jgi:hypothetical protein
MEGSTNMIVKIRIGHWRFTWTFAPVTDVTGVNSTLPEGDHVTMWDFDDVSLNLVVAVLEEVQCFYKLPNIYILNTGTPDHHIAYCFKAMPWRESVQIVASTKYVDPNFFKYGVYRERWTLRVTPKEGRKPRIVEILRSTVHEDASIDELNSWVKDTLGMQQLLLLCSTAASRLRDVLSTYPPKIRNTRRCYSNEEVGAKCHP